jgi:hypothetical protein
MGRKLFLPLTPDEARPPTVDVVRKRLGGRASTEPGPGELVTLVTDRGIERIGVVLFVRGEDLDVWIAGGVVRRARRSMLKSVEEERASADQGRINKDLFAIARDAESFADLVEGQRVRYQHDGGAGEGTLVEKCRFGGLIERGDGTLLGVGFRALRAAGHSLPLPPRPSPGPSDVHPFPSLLGAK